MQARIRITPPTPEEERSSLIHVILWPTIGAIIILIILVVLLYFVCTHFHRQHGTCYVLYYSAAWILPS